MPLQVPIYSDFDEAVVKIKQYLNSVKGSNFPLALQANAYLMLCVPRYPIDLFSPMWSYTGSLFTGFFTNVITSKKEYVYDGKKCIGIFMYPPIISNTCVSIGLISSGKVMGLSVFSDVTRIPNPKELVEIIKTINKE
jgi:hypothetical protein